jgi:hypothetical protein
MTTTTTTDSVTIQQIEQLRREAAEAGDTEQVSLCDLALSTWSTRAFVGGPTQRDAALRACVRAINAREDME